jgi:outer membrane receptor protein involved in Fe transport
VDESWGPRYEGQQVLHWDAFDKESYPEQYLQTRAWQAPENDVLDFWELGVVYKNNVGISKAGRNYGLRFSYGNQTGTGTMPNSEMLKNSVKVSGNANLTEKLSVSGAMNFVSQYMKGRPTVGYADNSVGQKFFQWGQRQLDYERLKDYKNNDGTQRTWNRKAWDNATPQYADNPYWSVYENYPEDERDRFYGNFSASYQITDALSASGAVYGDTYTFYVRERSAIGSQATSYYSENVRNRSEYNYEGRLSFDKQFGDIRISSVGGGNIRKVRYDSNYGITSGGLAVPGIFSVLNSNGSPSINDFSEEKQVNSLFLQGAVSYGGYLNVDASIRNDWSSTLPEDENSYFYYGVSGSFIFSELVDLAFMDLGKVRLGHTQVGNDTDPYRVKTTYSYNTDGSFGDAPRLFISNDLVNPNLKPETTTTNEVGLDLIFLGNRLDLSASYFNKVTTDQILPLEVSKATGYQTKYVNAGELSSKGFEVSLGVVPVRTQDFEWALRVNLTQTKQLVDKLYPGVDAIDIVRAPFGGVFLRASEGDEYGQLWGHDFVYDDNGNKVITSDGNYERTSLKPLGSVFPDYNMGIRNSLTYKNFDFSALIDIQQGGKFYSLSHMWGMYSGMLEESAAVNDKGEEIRSPVADDGGIKLDGVTGDITWNPDGTYTVTNTAENTTYIEGSTYSKNVYHGRGTPSAQSVFDADYIKLREVTLGYTLPQELTGFIKTVRISVYGRNLLTWGLDQEGFDPEMTVTGSGNIQGIDGGLQAMSRTFGVNLKLQF